MSNIRLEYRSCTCGTFDQARPKEKTVVDADGVTSTTAVDTRGDVQAAAPEYFDREGIVARRMRQLLLANKIPCIHHEGLHVKAVWIDGEKYEE